MSVAFLISRWLLPPFSFICILNGFLGDETLEISRQIMVDFLERKEFFKDKALFVFHSSNFFLLLILKIL